MALLQIARRVFRGEKKSHLQIWMRKAQYHDDGQGNTAKLNVLMVEFNHVCQKWVTLVFSPFIGQILSEDNSSGGVAKCSHQIISPFAIQILSVNLKSRRHGFPAPSARFPAALECVSSSSSFPQWTDRNPSFSTVWLQSCRFYHGNPFKVFKKKTPKESHG